jgi:EmrB/QacA subfamily drug resistance transporter
VSPPGPDTDHAQRHKLAVLAVLCVTLLLTSLDTTVLNVALPSIVDSLGATSSQLQWIVDAYALAFAGLLLSLGALGDRVGRKWIFMAGLALFGGGSAFAAWSASAGLLLVARAVMGIGAAALMPGTLSILIVVFSDQGEQARAIGVWSGTSGLGVAVGPILGGLLLAHFWWGSIFLINVPIAVVGLVAAAWLVPNSRAAHPRRADPAGAFLSMIGLVLVVWAVIEAPGRGWASPWTLAALLGGLAAIGAFVAWEHRVREPMLPLHFFADRTFSIAIGTLGLVIFALLGSFFLLTQYLQFALGYGPLAAGLRIAPIALAVLVIAPVAVLLARAVGTKVVVAAGLGVVASGLGILTGITVHTTYEQCVVPFLLVGAGVALTLSPCTASIMGSLPEADAGVGSATNDTAMQVGGALGVGILGTVLAFRYQGALAPLLAHAPVPAEARSAIEGSLGGALAVAERAPAPEGHALASAATVAFVSGMDLALVVATGITGLAAVLVALVLPNRRLGAGSATIPVDDDGATVGPAREPGYP